jgi:hypothetical protein
MIRRPLVGTSTALNGILLVKLIRGFKSNPSYLPTPGGASISIDAPHSVQNFYSPLILIAKNMLNSYVTFWLSGSAGAKEHRCNNIIGIFI